jgi:hypothetical protein
MDKVEAVAAVVVVVVYSQLLEVPAEMEATAQLAFKAF